MGRKGDLIDNKRFLEYGHVTRIPDTLMKEESNGGI